MLKVVIGALFVWSQLTATGGALPQVLNPAYKTASPVQIGRKAEVTMSFTVTRGYVINRTPPISLKVSPTAGVALDKMEFSTPETDPKSKDEYYAELPSIRIPVTASGGVGSLDDIIAVRDCGAPGVDAVIVGRALYSGAVRLAQALAATR